MKKYLASLSVLFMVVFLAGCSLGSAPADPKNPVVPAEKPSSVLKSVDGGKTWEFKSDRSGKMNMDAMDVLSMSINPYDGQNIFVGTLKDGILKTGDGGEDWSALVFPAEKVYGLVNDYVDGRIIYASGVYNGRGKIFKSLNGGADWNEIYTAPSDGPLVVAMANDRKNPGFLFAATSDKQLLRSTDAGVSWKNIYVSDSPVIKIVADGALIYINTQGGDLLISRDGGDKFEASAIKGDVNFIAIDPVDHDVAYVAGKAGLLRSKDAGKNWEELKTLGDPRSFPVKAVAVSPTSPAEVVYGAGQAVYKSVDGGANWMTSQLDTEKNISSIIYDMSNPSVLYLGLRKK